MLQTTFAPISLSPYRPPFDLAGHNERAYPFADAAFSCDVAHLPRARSKDIRLLPVSVRRTAWGVGEESCRWEVMRDSFGSGYGRNEAIIHDGRRLGPRGELSPRLASLAVRSAMVVRIRRMTDPTCSKKKREKRETTFAVSPVADSNAGRALIALRPPRVGPIDPIQQHGQLGRTQPHAGLIRRHDAVVAPSPPR